MAMDYAPQSLVIVSGDFAAEDSNRNTDDDSNG